MSPRGPNSNFLILNFPRPLRRFLKYTSITILSLLVIIVLLFSIALWYLTPERLTPLVNRYASQYLTADVRTSRVELTFWSTFPRLNVNVDSLTIRSRVFDDIPEARRATIPLGADSLLRLTAFSGGVNVMRLISGEIELYDVSLTDPAVRLYVLNESVANYNIVPPSPSTDSTQSPLPPIALNRFALHGQMPVRYQSVPDSIDATLTISETSLEGIDAPAYTLAFAGASLPSSLGSLSIPPVPFGLNGKVRWDQKNPSELALTDFRLSILDLIASFNTLLDLADTLTIRSLDIALPDVHPAAYLPLIPKQFLPSLPPIDTDLALSLEAALTKPYAPAVDSIPSLSATLRVEASRFFMQQMRLSKIDALIHAAIDGNSLNRSTINVDRLNVVGHAMHFNLSASVVNPISDPLVDGRFTGQLNLSRLPAELTSRFPFTVAGIIHGDSRFHFALSQLTPRLLHRARLDGNLSLADFRLDMTDHSMAAYIHRADLALGTHSKIPVATHVVDSMFTASLTIDTASLSAPGIAMAGRSLRLAIGSKNVAATTDTAQINPLGGSLSAQLITLNADSSNLHVRLSDALLTGALHRYNSQARAPQLDLRVQAEKIRYRTPSLRASLTDGLATLTLHPRARRPMSAAMKQRFDSIQAIHPTLSTDSIMALARRAGHKAQPSLTDGRENIDFALDQSISSWLRLWQATGQFTASRASVYTPYYPARSRASHINLAFSTDSVIITDTHLTSGRSDFTINGAVRNISRALTSRRHTPIRLDLDISSDTIDVNDLTATLLRGAAYSESLAASRPISPQALLRQADDDADADDDSFLDITLQGEAAGALLIPSNVTANIRLASRRILYGDLWLRRFEGILSIYDGALSLDRLRAHTDIGSLELTALYSAPTRRDISFAAGMNLKRLNLRRLIAQMPQIDTILPMLREIDGIVNAELALTTRLDSMMNLQLPTVDLALHIAGDSLVLLDSETFRTVAKWMMFKHKDRNMIDHMDVELTVRDGYLDLYPVIFDMDRYRLGVVGSNDMDLNLDYHVSVIRSPIPFRFGINIKGTPSKMKIRLGRARVNDATVASHRNITDSVRVNLLSQMSRLFRSGIRTAGTAGLRSQSRPSPRSTNAPPDTPDDTLTPADSAILIRQGLLPP